MIKKKRLDFEQHEVIGYNLQGISEYLLRFESLIAFKYGKTSKVYKNCRQATDYINKIRSELDNCVCSEYPGKTDREVVSVYYRNSQKKPILQITNDYQKESE